MTREARTERRRLVARRVFEALCAQYPGKYMALVQPGDATPANCRRDHGAKRGFSHGLAIPDNEAPSSTPSQGR